MFFAYCFEKGLDLSTTEIAVSPNNLEDKDLMLHFE